jgi:hypothetical protein
VSGILALDLGSETGWAALTTGNPRPVWGRVSFKKVVADSHNPDGAVMLALRDWLTNMIRRYEPNYLGAERPWIPQAKPIRVSAGGKLTAARGAIALNPQTISRLHGLYNVAAMVAAEHQVGWKEAGTWAVEKHFLGRSGHRSDEKKRLTKAMCETLGWKPVTLDESDSLALLSWMSAGLLDHGTIPGPLFASREMPS